jgi:hypothetical protein
MDMKSLLDKMTQLSQVDEETKKKPDADGDGVPDWADKKPGKDDHKDKEDKEKVDEAGMVPSTKIGKAMLAYKEAKKAEKKAWPQDGRRDAPSDFWHSVDKMDRMEKVKARLQKEGIEEAIAIQADGQEAMALLDMLKLAGQPAPQATPDVVVGGCGMTEADRDPAYANTPDEEVADMSAAVPSGNDMHHSKDGWRAAAGADNPMVAAMEGKLKKMFETLSKE